jgi:hypothetical protein
MSTIESAILQFHGMPAPVDSRASTPLRLRSSLAEPASNSEIESVWKGSELPQEVALLWGTCRSARLFEDVDYGQWGLVILDPEASTERTRQERENRSAEFRLDDIVIGAFLGDQELLVLAPSESGNRRVLIALPLDNRADWVPAASNLAEFLEEYFAAGGDKFWEPTARH